MATENDRLEAQRQNSEQWSLWGPYLSERAWGTVREDYSSNGAAWDYFNHDQARSRAYRWSEDGLGGISDDQQRLCFALALWNGCDPFLKERAFGLTGKQGNHGEDVKEYYFYVDATPSHSYLKYQYKYPQSTFPYNELIEKNAQLDRKHPPYNLIDTGVFNQNKYWDVVVEYAKESPHIIHIRISATNRGSQNATLHMLPTLWYRNTWSWGKYTDRQRPIIEPQNGNTKSKWSVKGQHSTFGTTFLYGSQPATLLFTENDSNTQRLWNNTNKQPFVKDAFHRHVVEKEFTAVNPQHRGSKFAAWHETTAVGGNTTQFDLVLSNIPINDPFATSATTFDLRGSEANQFYDNLIPEADAQDKRILRQALAGMIWTKQYFHYDVSRWLDGDQYPTEEQRRKGRNHRWRHFKARDIISMPDSWEYPWFAAWDLAYHAGVLALIDIDFAKHQMELMLKEHFLHPNGQIPAYEWSFGDVNPPVQAMGALKVFRSERIQRGVADYDFLKRVFNKLLLNYAWWINRKDSDGNNVFEGGFLGLDNISVLNRSQPLPPGYSLKQADATGWMAKFALNLTIMALELAVEDRNYEDIAIQTYQQFLAIANSIAGYSSNNDSLWDEKDGFFKDLVCTPDGTCHRINVFSWVGLIPFFACEVIDQRLLKNVPRFQSMLYEHKGGLFDGQYICACPAWENERGEHLLALVDHTMIQPILQRVLNEDEFLSTYGIRSVSRAHAHNKNLGVLPGIGEALIDYVPGEADSGLFGGNSNWRGPIWLPTNYSLIQSLERYYRFLGKEFKVSVPCMNNAELNLREISNLIAQRLVNLYRKDQQGKTPAYPVGHPMQNDPHWRELHLFYEYFHGETGQGLGAAHQTGWTGLIANLLMRQHRQDIPPYWKAQMK